MAPDWMNWPIWRWVTLFGGIALGFYIGWDMRSTKARLEEYVRRLRERDDGK